MISFSNVLICWKIDTDLSKNIIFYPNEDTDINQKYNLKIQIMIL